MRQARRHTVSSYGIICYRLKIDFNGRCLHPEFLLVQRKDSLAFVEFVRGKYVPEHTSYVMQLVSGMTRDEQTLLATEPFDVLWKRVWGSRMPHSARCSVEHAASRRAYETLLETWGGDLTQVVERAGTALSEREFGFPKGRKCGGETDIACAVREFHEETGVDPSCIHVYCLRPQEEVFEGGNGILYRHVYYLARIVDMRGAPSRTPRAGTLQAQEVSCVKWASFPEMCDKFAGSESRVDVAKRANADIFRVLDPDPQCVTFSTVSDNSRAEEVTDDTKDAEDGKWTQAPRAPPGIALRGVSDA